MTLLHCGSQSIPLPKYIELRRQHPICQKVPGFVLDVIVCGVNEALTCQPLSVDTLCRAGMGKLGDPEQLILAF